MTPTGKVCLGLLAALFAFPSGLSAGPPRGEGSLVGGFGRPAFLDHVFRPEQVMRHQAAIGLTAEQRESISGAIRETQQRLLALRWQFDGRAEEAAKVFAGERIDPDPALTLAAAAMEVESEIKKEHLRLLIRIKNELTPEQQEKLRALTPKRCGPDRD